MTAPVRCPRCGIGLGQSSITTAALHVRHCAGPVARFAVEAWLILVCAAAAARHRGATSTYDEVSADLERQDERERAADASAEFVDEAWLSVGGAR